MESIENICLIMQVDLLDRLTGSESGESTVAVSGIRGRRIHSGFLQADPVAQLKLMEDTAQGTSKMQHQSSSL